MNGYLSVLDRQDNDYHFPTQLEYFKIPPLCQQKFYDLASFKGDIDKVVFIADIGARLNFAGPPRFCERS